MDETERQRQFEDQFLSQIRAKAGALVRGAVPVRRGIIVSKKPKAKQVRKPSICTIA